MKKILITLSLLLLVGCVSSNVNKTINLEELRNTIEDTIGYNDDTIYDETMISQLFNLSKDLYQEIEIIGSNPNLSPRTLEIVMVHSNKDKLGAVKEAIEKRIEYGKGPNTEFYGSMENAEYFTIGDYVFLIVGNDPLAIKEIIEKSFV